MNTVFRIAIDMPKLGSQATIPCFQGDSVCTIIDTLTEGGFTITNITKLVKHIFGGTSQKWFNLLTGEEAES